MTQDSEKRSVRFGGKDRPNGSPEQTPEQSPEPTLRNAMIESTRLIRKIAVWVTLATIVAVVGYLLGGPAWTWSAATGVGVLLLVRILVEVFLWP